MTTQSAPAKPRAKDYSRIEPLPDPPWERDMRQHEVIQQFDGQLIAFFAHRDDVLISGAGYLCEDAGNLGEFYPDCVFAQGVESPEWIKWRNGYVISEVGKPPDFVLEVGSRSTGRRDYTVKRVGYAAYGVLEYWRFDPSGGKFHDAPIAGDRLVDGEYAPLEIVHEPGGLLWGYSEVLGLELWWIKGEFYRAPDVDAEVGELRFRNPATGEFLPTTAELALERAEAKNRASAAETRANAAETRADAERAARVAAEGRAADAEARMAEMEAELRRLRGE